MMDRRPTHLARTGDDGKTVFLCGAKRKGNTGPFVGTQHAQAHIEGRGMTPCPDCVTTTEQLTLL